MYSQRRALWLYPLFQIPLILLVVCVIASLLCLLLSLGKPHVSVAIALDLSSSTYQNQTFNAPGTILNQEIEAVRTYLAENDQLKRPNQVQVFGFGGTVVPLTQSFQSDSQQVQAQLNQSLRDSSLSQRVDPNKTNVNAALQDSSNALQKLSAGGCKEILLVTDGTGDEVEEAVIQSARSAQVRINVLLVTDNPLQNLGGFDLAKAALQTKGLILPGQVGNLNVLFIDKFFARFNSNLRWVLFWLGLAAVSLAWVLVLPLDRWLFQKFFRWNMTQAGQAALGFACFWSVLIPLLLWRVMGLPFFSACT